MWYLQNHFVWARLFAIIAIKIILSIVQYGLSNCIILGKDDFFV